MAMTSWSGPRCDEIHKEQPLKIIYTYTEHLESIIGQRMDEEAAITHPSDYM